jgi:hypothetical protein
MVTNSGYSRGCVDPKFKWFLQGAPRQTQCFCSNHGEAQSYWDCFYRAVDRCVRTPSDLVDMNSRFPISPLYILVHNIYITHRVIDIVLVGEYTWREQRRLHCVDDWKPNPPWHLMRSAYLIGQYHHERKIQYIQDWSDNDLPSGPLE